MRAKSINFVASSIFIEYSSNSIAVTEVVTSQKTWIDLEAGPHWSRLENMIDLEAG